MKSNFFTIKIFMVGAAGIVGFIIGVVVRDIYIDIIIYHGGLTDNLHDFTLVNRGFN